LFTKEIKDYKCRNQQKQDDKSERVDIIIEKDKKQIIVPEGMILITDFM